MRKKYLAPTAYVSACALQASVLQVLSSKGGFADWGSSLDWLTPSPSPGDWGQLPPSPPPPDEPTDVEELPKDY